MKRLLLLTLLLFSGCGHPARVKVGGVDFTPPVNAETPSNVNVSSAKTETALPAGTVKTIVEVFSDAGIPTSKETTYRFSSESREVTQEAAQSVVVSNERPPDKSVELFKAKADEREPLLWVAIGLGVAGLIVAVVLKYPVIGLQIAGIGGGGAFAAWKFAEVPGWLWGLGLVMAFLSWAFYTRGQWDKDGNGVPDFIQKKSP